jgi:phosphopantetheine--protein transferase-like protein
MVVGVGVDICSIKRFEPWVMYSASRLSKVFTHYELVAYLQEVGKYYDLREPEVKRRLAGYIAVRYAAKEAFYKALSSTLISLNATNQPFTFLFACSYVEIVKGIWDVPFLRVEWESFKKKIKCRLPHLETHLSLSHEHDYALAHVIISL